jgi:hypothetical protein
MVNAKLFKADGGKIRGLIAVWSGKLAAIPEKGDYISMGTAIGDTHYKVEDVAFLINEDAVRLAVSPISI